MVTKTIFYYSITLITLLFSFNVYSQGGKSASGKISYRFYRNLGIPVAEDWQLNFKNSESLFEQKGRQESLEEDQGTQTDLNKKFSLEVKVKPHYITNLKNKKIQFQGLVFTTPYYVSEDLETINWQLQKDEKNIGNFKCQKATADFRGRHYTAWFTQEIPVNLGPWKFNGLPGLILEIRDDKGEIELIATKVDISSNDDPSLDVAKEHKKGEKVSLQEYVKLKDNEGDEISRYISTKLSRGSSSTGSFTSAGRDSRIEITYEWEN